jgi:hypothetical protein
METTLRKAAFGLACARAGASAGLARRKRVRAARARKAAAPEICAKAEPAFAAQGGPPR